MGRAVTVSEALASRTFWIVSFVAAAVAFGAVAVYDPHSITDPAFLQKLFTGIGGFGIAVATVAKFLSDSRASAKEDARITDRLETLQDRLEQPLLVSPTQIADAKPDAAQAEDFTEPADTAKAARLKADDRVQSLWLGSQLTLEKYWNRNLAQNGFIFSMSVLASSFGFLVLLWAVFIAVQDRAASGPSLVAATAGAVTQVIGATFLVIYKSTSQQGAVYTQTLERLTSAGLAWSMILTMEEETPEARSSKDAAKLTLASAVLGQPNTVHSTTEAVRT
jgi:hypothetical protein